MTSSKVGIKSLASRLDNLEQAVSSGTTSSTTSSTPSSFADQLISVTVNTVKDDLNTVLQHYEDGLTSLGININDFQLVDLVKAIPYTITYVETNATVIAGILKKDITSGLKLNTAITFLKQYITTDEKLLVSWITHEVDILFNDGKNTLTTILPNTKKSAISTGSISKANSKKFMLSFSKNKT